MSYAYYRLPYSHTYTKVVAEREPCVLLRCLEEIGNEGGFVIAPFACDGSLPIVLLRPDVVHTDVTPVVNAGHCDAESAENAGHCDAKQPAVTTPDAAYVEAFDAFHTAICDGQFRKLVLARTKIVGCNDQDAERMFFTACNAYPRLMIMLFSTPHTGTWIIASPEILVEVKERAYHTMALAGTMPYNDGYAEWSDKNKEEQHVVEQYIEHVITPFSVQVVKDGPYTSRAGDLQHLRTDFRFHLKDDVTLGNVVKHLHPTPAVCGQPTDAARQFILSHEGVSRRYYSGFAGPVGLNGETHLYVSLRCAEIKPSQMVLYAGGGIMPESTCQSEWTETESKMQTVGMILRNR